MSRSKPFYSKRDKKWYINFTTPDGKRRKRKIGDTKTEAYASWKASFVTGGFGADLRFSVVADQWLSAQDQRREKGEVSTIWIKRVTRTIEKFDKDHPGVKCSKITHAVADAWLPSDSSSSYRRSDLSVIRQCLKWAQVEAKLILVSPLEDYKLPPDEARKGLLSPQDHNKFCRAAPLTVRRMLRIAWRTGCRPAELRELKWSEIHDFSYAELEIHKTVKKSKKPRIIYFSREVSLLLQKIKREQPPEQIYVFLNARGRPFSKNAFVNVMRRLRKKCGVQGVTAYHYRHAFLTAALKQLPPATVAALAGHSNMQMLIRVYDKTSQQKSYLADAANRCKPPT